MSVSTPLVLLLALLALPPSHQQSTQRLTTCACDQSPQQRFSYPDIGDSGVISLALDASGRQRCLVFVPGGPCSWDSGTCIELGSCFSPRAALPNFNVTPGITPGTVIFRILSGLSNEEPNRLCIDLNSKLQLLEPYPCYDSYENKQQELIETAGGGLQESSNGKCLCPDTRNSNTPTCSPSPTLPPPQPPSGEAAAKAAAARSLGLGLGIPLGLLAAAALGLYIASLATGTPIAALLKGGLGSSAAGGASLYRQSAIGGAGSEQASLRAKELLASEATGLLK